MLIGPELIILKSYLDNEKRRYIRSILTHAFLYTRENANEIFESFWQAWECMGKDQERVLICNLWSVSLPLALRVADFGAKLDRSMVG